MIYQRYANGYIVNHWDDGDIEIWHNETARRAQCPLRSFSSMRQVNDWFRTMNHQRRLYGQKNFRGF